MYNWLHAQLLRRISFYEFYDVLHVVGMGEHIYRLHLFDAVEFVQQREVARLRGRIAAHVNDPFGRGAEYSPQNVLVHACAGRVEYDNVGPAVFFDKTVA